MRRGSLDEGPSLYWIGPVRVIPAKPVVLVATPSIAFARNETSSTYTPGDRYSGMDRSSDRDVEGGEAGHVAPEIELDRLRHRLLVWWEIRLREQFAR